MTICKSMTLAQLLPADTLGADVAVLEIAGLCNDSRRVRSGDLFLACQGASFDGAQFIDAVVQAGAIAVLVDADRDLPQACVPVIPVRDLSHRVAELAVRFYANPSQALHCIGVTGTNGKTSTSHFIARALQQLGCPAGVIGTNGNGFPDDLQPATHTTPDPLQLQHLLADLAVQGAESVVMEVSSHALDQQRIAGVCFRQAVFTNLTRDHLDYHGTLEHYGAAKARLFAEYGVEQAIINLDDAFGRQLAKSLPAQIDVLGYSLGRLLADPAPANDAHVRLCRVIHAEFSTQGIKAEIDTPWGKGLLRSTLLGSFNLGNLLATVAVLCGRGFPLPRVLEQLATLPKVEGRMQPVRSEGAALVVVDYAHTPDALEKALQALRSHCEGVLWCVFGCGGDRDRGKRPLMAAVAEQCADRIVITSDNPRREDPELIIDDIVAGLRDVPGVKRQLKEQFKGPLKGQDRVERVVCREEAIAWTLSQAGPNDVVLLAGKGHEHYQEIQGVRYPFSDAAVVEAVLAGDARFSAATVNEPGAGGANHDR